MTEYNIIKDHKTGVLALVPIKKGICFANCYDEIAASYADEEPENPIPEDEFELMELFRQYYYMDRLDHEESFVVGFDYYGRVKGIFNCGKGNHKEVTSSQRSIAIFLLLVGARSFAFFHNHPDDVICPSEADILHSNYMRTFGANLEMTFKESYIIAPSGWCRVSDSDSGRYYKFINDFEEEEE